MQSLSHTTILLPLSPATACWIGLARSSGDAIETKARAWLARNVRKVWEGSGRRFGISRDTVRSAMWMPSFRVHHEVWGRPRADSPRPFG